LNSMSYEVSINAKVLRLYEVVAELKTNLTNTNQYLKL
jgi:hypothetical protein